MIKNQKQASSTKKELEKLISAKQELLASKESIEPFKLEMGENALNSLIYDLELELKEYSDLKEGKTFCLNNKSIEDLSSIIIASRIAQNKTHKDLAELMDIPEQQIQRYESNDYEGVRWETLSEIALVLGLSLKFKSFEISANTNIKEFLNRYAENETITRVSQSLKERKSFFVSSI
jgi:transcriptional regulator with XRE-family HTH domain